MPESLKFLDGPKVVAPVCTAADLASLADLDLEATCDLVELRLDCLLDHLDEIAPAIEGLPCPIVATARHPAEGGAGDLDAVERCRLLERFLPLVQAIDVEVRSLDSLQAAVAAGRARGVSLIASYHDFEKCPPIEELHQVVLQAFAAEAAVAKIAVHLDCEDDVIALRSLFAEWRRPHLRLSLMGMGPLGRASRLELAKAGSVLNYGYLIEPNAPGQWPAAELKARIAAF